MKFDIVDPKVQAKKKKAKKKEQDKMFFAMTFFLLLTLIILVVYYMTMDNKKTVTPPAPKVIQQSRLKIVNENNNERPLAIVIDNSIGNTYHAGLQDSYINYEMIVEGGITRILAIYKDKEVKLVGPVRSARHYFLDYAMDNDAVFVHYGWSPYAKRDIKNLDINNINGMTNASAFVRDPNIEAPHNVFVSTTKLRNTFSNKGYEQESNNWKLLNYSYTDIDLAPVAQDDYLEEGVPEAKQANKVSMTYASNQIRSYTYDKNNRYYLRYMNNKPQLDRATKEQLHYKNIIIIKVENKTIDSAGRQELATTGTGEGFFITNGATVPIIWTKDSRSSKMILTYTNDEEVRVNDGNTFIQIVPINSKIEFE